MASAQRVLLNGLSAGAIGLAPHADCAPPLVAVLPAVGFALPKVSGL
jgi:hypothetical protein